MDQAVANARLEGVELDDKFVAALLRVAKGELDGDVLVAQLVDQYDRDQWERCRPNPRLM